MSGLRTLLFAHLALVAVPASAGIEMVFAGCVGRMSAEMEHAWLLGQDGEEALERRAVFLSLLEATSEPAQAREILAHRIASKMSQASLLTVATFGDDTERALRAAEVSQAQVAGCQRLLLDS